jgi:DHA1 family bicyclomycin/chloramphenicol resistance-like MFS transporter
VSEARAPGTAGFVALIAAVMTVTAMTIDINLPAIPSMVATLGTDLTRAQLTVTTFFVGFALGQAVWGPLSDRYGRRPALLAGMAVYIATTVGCAVSPTMDALLLLRVAQGFGAGAGPVVGRAVIRDLFEGPVMARVMSLIMAVFILAPIVAPTLGAIFLTFNGWRGIFVFLAIYGIAITALGAFMLKESLERPDPEALRAHRLTGAFAAIFRNPASRSPALVVVLTYGTLTIYLATSAAIFMDGFGLSPEQFGLVFAVVALSSAAGSLLNSRLVRHVPLASIVRSALIVGVAVAALTLALTLFGLRGYWHLILGFAAVFVCFGLVSSNGMTLALAPHGHIAGSAAAALGFSHTLAPAAIASVVAAAYDGTAVPALVGTLILFVLSLAIFRTGGVAGGPGLRQAGGG